MTDSTPRFLVTVTLDAGAIELEAARRCRPLDVVTRELLGDVECRLYDAVRYRDGVDSVRVALVENAGAPASSPSKAGRTVAG